MNTIQILGVLTALEIIAAGAKFNGVTIVLWVLYGIYKLLAS